MLVSPFSEFFRFEMLSFVGTHSEFKEKKYLNFIVAFYAEGDKNQRI